MTRAALATAFVLPALLVASAPRTLAQTPAPITIPAKFDTSTEHVLIPVSIGGSSFWCNPDTGFSALSPSTGPKLRRLDFARLPVWRRLTAILRGEVTRAPRRPWSSAA